MSCIPSILDDRELWVSGLSLWQELQIDSFLSKWLRYTAFVVLYPLGVSSEISIVYLAMPYIKTSHLWSLAMPNALNFAFSYHYLCILTTFCYLPCKSREIDTTILAVLGDWGGDAFFEMGALHHVHTPVSHRHDQRTRSCVPRPSCSL